MEKSAVALLVRDLPDETVRHPEPVNGLDGDVHCGVDIEVAGRFGVQVKPTSFRKALRENGRIDNTKRNERWPHPVLYLYYCKQEGGAGYVWENYAAVLAEGRERIDDLEITEAAETAEAAAAVAAAPLTLKRPREQSRSAAESDPKKPAPMMVVV